MGRRTTELPLAAMYRILKSAGAERVSDSAKRALAKEIERYASRVAEKAVKLARHAGRKTVTESDIELAK